MKNLSSPINYNSSTPARIKVGERFFCVTTYGVQEHVATEIYYLEDVIRVSNASGTWIKEEHVFLNFKLALQKYRENQL